MKDWPYSVNTCVALFHGLHSILTLKNIVDFISQIIFFNYLFNYRKKKTTFSHFNRIRKLLIFQQKQALKMLLKCLSGPHKSLDSIVVGSFK